MPSEMDDLRKFAQKISSNFEEVRGESIRDVDRLVRDIILIEKKYTHREGSSDSRESEIDKKVRNYIEDIN